MTRETRRKISTVIRYTLLILVGIIMVYPLIWMVGATFKTNSEIFTSAWFIPKNPVFDGYDNAFKSYGGKIDLVKSLINTYKIVIPKVIFTVVSATITAYGFGRFNFKGKNIFFALLMSTLFLPQVVLNAPQYIMFNNWKWVNTYLPLVIPSLFAADTYFVFMLIQFLRGVPKELEEAAKIDGCNTLKTLWYVIVPMLKPSLVSCALFQFMWAFNDFQGPLIYIDSVKKYPTSLGLRLLTDAETGFEWNKVLALSVITLLPSLIVFFLAQDQFVDGIAAGGVKG